MLLKYSFTSRWLIICLCTHLIVDDVQGSPIFAPLSEVAKGQYEENSASYQEPSLDELQPYLNSKYGPQNDLDFENDNKMLQQNEWRSNSVEPSLREQIEIQQWPLNIARSHDGYALLHTNQQGPLNEELSTKDTSNRSKRGVEDKSKCPMFFKLCSPVSSACSQRSSLFISFVVLLTIYFIL